MGVGPGAGAAGPKAGGAKAGGAETVGAGDVTVFPQTGQGPLIPAKCAGTVSTCWQLPHANWMTSGFMGRVKMLNCRLKSLN
ncbi:hypothetical protein BGE01nite_19210 [Brevifollis gellanilyticus]|uniref:Uncharacterized protein n=1 Tax=Brevifollis gellanilyticus TaxID=748831 RepID=A0A512M7B6_9BACT|nr:hypothetical protein BGE01nite_19210 [Brevifollis gellanilyticus]